MDKSEILYNINLDLFILWMTYHAGNSILLTTKIINYHLCHFIGQVKKGKFNPVHAMKAGIRSRCKPSLILNLSTRQTLGSQLHALAVLHPREWDPSTYWIGDWLGPRVSLDILKKIKIFCPKPESYHSSSIIQPVAQSILHCILSLDLTEYNKQFCILCTKFM